jgi:hypothetical protein
MTHPKSFDIIEKFHKFKVLLLPCYPRIVIWAGRGPAPRFQMVRPNMAVWSMGLSEVLAIKGNRSVKPSSSRCGFWILTADNTSRL